MPGESAEPPTLDEAEAGLKEELERIVDAAIAEARAGAIRRVAAAALGRGRYARLRVAGIDLGQGFCAIRSCTQSCRRRRLPAGGAEGVGLSDRARGRQNPRGPAADSAGGQSRSAGGLSRRNARAVAGGQSAARGDRSNGPGRHLVRRERQDAPKGTRACPRYEERAAVRSAGGDAAALCGSHERGFCAHHEKADRSLPQCHYRSQREEVAQADVVLFAGGTALSDMPPEWTARKLPAHLPLIDPETGAIVPGITVTREDVRSSPVTRRRRSTSCSSMSQSTTIRPTGLRSH